MAGQRAAARSFMLRVPRLHRHSAMGETGGQRQRGPRRARVIGAVLAGLAALCVVYRADADFLVSTHNAGGNALPDVATDSAGRFAVVWESFGQQGEVAIAGRIFDAYANPGAEFQVNTATVADLGGVSPGVGMAPDGEFTVAWRSGFDIVAQRFSIAGLRLGPESTVSNANDNPDFPDVAMDQNDHSAIAWVNFNAQVVLGRDRKSVV